MQRPVTLYSPDAILEARTGELYLQFDQDRKRAEAIEADQQDEADLKALENILKKRPKS